MRVVKNIAKWLLRGVLIVVGLSVIVVALMFFPPVQDFVKRRATEYVGRTMGVRLDIRRLRLRFPLTLAVDGTVLCTVAGDTLARAGGLRVGVAPMPLLRGEVQVRRFAVSDAAVDWADSTMALKGSIAKLELDNVRVVTRRKVVRARSAAISGADVELILRQSSADTTSTRLPAWRIDLGRLDVDNASFRMGDELDAGLVVGRVDDVEYDLGTGRVEAGRVRVEEGRGRYMRLVGVTGMQLDAGDVRIGEGGEMALNIRELELRERRGVRVSEGRGSFAMDSAGVRVKGFRVITDGGTRIEADAELDAAALTMNPSAAVRARVDMRLAESDVHAFYALPGEFRGQAAMLKADVDGTLNDLVVNELVFAAAPYAELTARGRVRSLTEPGKLSGRLNIEGLFGDLQHFMPAGVRVPKHISVKGSVAAGGGRYTPDLHIAADGGTVDIKGTLDMLRKTYRADLAAVDFPVGALLPVDSLGAVSMTLAAHGSGFDILAPTTRADLAVNVRRVDYKGFSYRDIVLSANLEHGHAEGKLTGEGDALRFGFDIAADLAKENYMAKIDGGITHADLAKMGFSATPLVVGGEVNIVATARTGVYTADVALDSATVTTKDKRYDVERTTFVARADTARVVSTLRSGDIYAVFNAPVGVDSLATRLRRIADTISRQVAARDFRFATIDGMIPAFTLNMQMGRRNAVCRMLAADGTGFGIVTMNAVKGDTMAFRVRALATGFHTAGIMLDTLNAGASVRGDGLNYHLRLANRPGNLEQLAMIFMHGQVEGKSATANFHQRNRAGQSGFEFGVEAYLGDSMVRATLVPAQGRRRGSAAWTDSLTFAYEPWGVNQGNYIEWRGGRNFRADFDLQSHQIRPGVRRRVTVQSLAEPGAIMLGVSQLDIAKTLDLLPAPPPLEGMVDLHMNLGLGGRMIEANGTAAATGIVYDGRRVGDMSTKVATRAEASGRWTVQADATVNNSVSLAASGIYDAQGVDFVVKIPEFPLAAVNAFLPADAAVMTGRLTADATVKGPLGQPRIDGTLGFVDGRLTVPMAGTTFKITPQQMRIANNRIRLRDFGLTSPNNKLLALNGTVDIAAMRADLALQGAGFQVVNASRNVGSQIYGTAALDADMTIRGPLAELVIRGDLTVLRSTRVLYTMKDSPLDLADSKQQIVTFIPFTDSLAMEMQALRTRSKSGGVDIQLGIDIEDQARATVNLSDNGNDRIELTGGGALAFAMNRQGDMRLTGRYELSGGTVVYNPPIPTVTQKNFSVADGSYVAWTGAAAAPEFNINALQTIHAAVTEEGSKLSRGVDFVMSVAITGTLNAMQITFDLAAPNDLAIQNELLSLAPEQRSAQAMSLMIYNTYTGPGTTARVDTGNAVNSFIEKELNQWARNSLRGVDLSFGIRSTDDGLGGQHTDYSYKVSKNLFNDRVKLTVGGGISDGTTTEANMRDNFINDLSVEYKLARWDNLYLKAYRYNKQVSVLEGQVVETGAGVLYRKRMERLRDLFRLNRAPERRAARREVRDRERREITDSMRVVWRARRDSMGVDDVSDSVWRQQWRARRDSLRQLEQQRDAAATKP